MSTPDTAEREMPFSLPQMLERVMNFMYDYEMTPGDDKALRKRYADEKEAFLGRIASLEADRARLAEYQEREAAVCPEDFGFEEVIEVLRRDEARLNVLEKMLSGEGKIVADSAGIDMRTAFGEYVQGQREYTRFQSLREAADAEILRRSNTGDTSE